MAISQKLLNDGESIVVSMRTHLKALLLPALVLLVTLGVAVWLQTVLDDKADGIPVKIVWVLAILLVAWYVVRPLLTWLTTTYTITNRRLITRTGILTRRGHDIPLNRVSDVAYEHGLIDRMLGCGTLIISDASTNGRVLLHDIPHAEEVHRQMNQLLHELNLPRTDNEGT